MDAANRIRQAVADVALLRELGLDDAALRAAVIDVKRVQARRFSGTYSDMMAGGPYQAPAKFFLEELYSDKDYAERDAQFARIAGAIDRFFPGQVASTAVSLAELHSLTEHLDFAMGRCWLASHHAGLDDAVRYVRAWREVGRRADRVRQIDVVLGVGHEMARLTRARGLRTMLRMMRGPATASGLASLQRFLETGFDTFSEVARRPGGAEQFLETIRQRETGLIETLFDDDLVACETEFGRILGQAR